MFCLGVLILKYEIEPIGVRITEEKKSSLIHFLVRLMAILGGIFVCVGIFHDATAIVGKKVGLIPSKKND
jgi:hypothetical protein